jgi:anti-anti-sigma factor
MTTAAVPNASPAFDLRTHQNALVLQFRGDLGSLRWEGREHVEREVLRALANGPRGIVVVDLSEVRFGGSEFVEFLLRLKERLHAFGCALVLAGGRRSVLHVIHLLRLDQTLPHYDTLEGALSRRR